MSDLNNILEKYKARSGDEQNFMDKHTDNVQVTDAPGGEVAKKAADKMKKHDRKKHRQGLTPEEEEDMYEENEDLLDVIDDMIRDYYEEEASAEEKEMLEEMMSSADGYSELVDMVFEEKDDDEDDDERNDNTDERYSSIFWLNVVIGLILALIFFFVADYIGNFYNEPKVSYIVKWMSLSFIFGSLGIIQSVILRKDLNFKIVTLRSFYGSLTGGIVGVLMAFSDFGVYSLVAKSLVSSLVGVIIFYCRNLSLKAYHPDHRFAYFLFEFSEIYRTVLGGSRL